MMRMYLEGVGLFGPGLESWEASRATLAGQAPYTPTPLPLPAATLLPANERRRAPKIVRIALATGAEALAAAGRNPALVPAVFTSSGGDGDTIHEIMSTLASAQRALSPTRFHNSVHNAAAGYWSIATGSRAASSSLCCHDGSFAAGLLEATVQAVTENEAVALIAYDVPYPSPLAEARPIGTAFGAALVLSPVPTPASFARLELALSTAHPLSHNAAPALENLRRATPAARCLPLLTALAVNRAAAVTLEYLPDLALSVHITPQPEERA
jgi:hypothetical protein